MVLDGTTQIPWQPAFISSHLATKKFRLRLLDYDKCLITHKIMSIKKMFGSSTLMMVDPIFLLFCL